MSAKYMHVNSIRHKFGVFFIERRRAVQYWHPKRIDENARRHASRGGAPKMGQLSRRRITAGVMRCEHRRGMGRYMIGRSESVLDSVDKASVTQGHWIPRIGWSEISFCKRLAARLSVVSARIASTRAHAAPARLP